MHILTGTRSALVIAASLLLASAQGQSSAAGTPATEDARPDKIIIPESSREKPRDKGKRAHTNYEIRDTGGPVTPPKPGRTAPGK
jgi:hypothetical protein